MAHKYPPWRRVILVPFWSIQLFLMVLIIGLLLIVTNVLIRNGSSIDYDVRRSLKLSIPIWCGLSAICAVIIIVEMVSLPKRKLTPAKFLICNVIKSTIWTVLFVIDIISWMKQTITAETAPGVAIEVAIVLSFYIPLVYGGIVYHKHRKGNAAYNPLTQPPHHNDTTYHSQLHSTHPELGTGPPAYHGQVSGTTAAYDPYKPSNMHSNQGDLGLAHQQQYQQGHGNVGVPPVYVQHHDNVYEMDTRRNLT